MESFFHVKFGAWLSLVERSVRDREVAGSNPVAPICQRHFCPAVSAGGAVFGIYVSVAQLDRATAF